MAPATRSHGEEALVDRRRPLAICAQLTNLLGRDNVSSVREFEYQPQPDGSVRVVPKCDDWLQQLPVVGLTWDFS